VTFDHVVSDAEFDVAAQAIIAPPLATVMLNVGSSALLAAELVTDDPAPVRSYTPIAHRVRELENVTTTVAVVPVGTTATAIAAIFEFDPVFSCCTIVAVSPPIVTLDTVVPVVPPLDPIVTATTRVAEAVPIGCEVNVYVVSPVSFFAKAWYVVTIAIATSPALLLRAY
jgi:hypothetical protein